MAIATEMDVYTAIQRRRTIKQYTGAAIPRDVIARLLDAAVLAPNHHLTQPWRFTVLTGAAKDALAALRREQVAGFIGDTSGAGAQAKLDDAYRKMAGAAALIVVSAKGDADPLIAQENRFATAAATQNILLAATQEGLASFWSSGVAPYPPARAYLNLPDDETIIAVVHLGYTETELPPRRRRAAQELTRWFDTAPAR